jgi:hypothetical protein
VQLTTDLDEDAARRHFDDLTPLQIIETSMMKVRDRAVIVVIVKVLIFAIGLVLR